MGTLSFILLASRNRDYCHDDNVPQGTTRYVSADKRKPH
ncbi:exopolysaccharide synthesis ExoD [Vibrio furnissii NCTC 11218]|nr:exopolysaccharide synthesis ExoD [Vibrio furnissii NCTC 11218]